MWDAGWVLVLDECGYAIMGLGYILYERGVCGVIFDGDF